MRETKDHTIIRLKREVAELKEAVRGQKRMAKEKIKESKEALIQSQSKSKADLRGQINKYKSDYNKLKEQYDRIRDKFYTLMMRKSRDKREALFSMELAVGLDREWYERITEDNRKRLEAYQNGDTLDPYGNLYFFDNNLMLTINPKTGERLTLSQLAEVYNLLRTQSEYLSAIKEAAQLRRYNDGYEYLEFINQKGQEFYEEPLPPFPFDIISWRRCTIPCHVNILYCFKECFCGYGRTRTFVLSTRLN